MKKLVALLLVLVAAFIIVISSMSSRGSTRTRSSYPQTYKDAYNEYQKGNKKPLEDFYRWLEKNP